MISVYLCDDEPSWLQRMENCIISYQLNSDWDFSISCRTTDPDTLLSYIRVHTPQNGIYFLDIDYKKNLNGMTLGQKIRQIDPDALLIFVTTHEEMVMETFRLKLMALDFIIKDDKHFHEQICQCLQHIENLYLSNTDTSSSLTLHTTGSYKIISKKDIYYIEAQKGCHKILIHTKTGLLSVNHSLSAIYEELGSNFLFCSKSCLVNRSHIVAANHDEKELVLDNGQICYCSVRMWKKVIAALRS